MHDLAENKSCYPSEWKKNVNMKNHNDDLKIVEVVWETFSIYIWQFQKGAYLWNPLAEPHKTNVMYIYSL